MVSEKEILLKLSRVNGFGYKKYLSLKKHLGKLSALEELSETELSQIPGIGEKLSKAMRKALEEDDCIEEILSKKVFFITIEEPAYPPQLREIPSPPVVLYSTSPRIEHLKTKTSIAIVGTRKPTTYGRTIARKFAMELASLGINVVSGLALGIDAEAHRGAMDVNGYTTAVVGTGIDVIYPPENENLWKSIAERGTILTEFPPGTPPLSHNFPRRNRIIAGLSKAVLVVEAPRKSGALITANMAAEYGKDVMAIPGPIHSSASEGTNNLIKEGAIPITSVEDILEAIKYREAVENNSATDSKHIAKPFTREKDNAQDEPEKLILEILQGPMHIEEISRKAQIPTNRVLMLLTKLKIRGLVEQMPGGYFSKSFK